MLSKRRLSAATRTIDNNIQKVLQKIEKNNSKVDELVLGDRLFSDTFNRFRIELSSSGKDVTFNSSEASDFSTLGASIATNTNLTKLSIVESVITALDASNRDFYDGLKQNSSINYLFFNCRDPLGEVAEEILKVYQINGSQLHRLSIMGANLRIGSGHTILVTTLQRCTNLKYIRLCHCNINYVKLLPIVEAIRGHSSLETLSFGGNSIRSTGCTALAALLEDPNCNINKLPLYQNRIDEEGTTIIANSLANNASLQKLDLHNNPIPFDQTSEEPFCNALCNTTSINSIHSSNHTLEYVRLYPGLSRQVGPELRSLLTLNKIENKRQVAIRKILLYHPNIDMKPLFDMASEDEEWSLKGLPYVVAWFERANEIFPKVKNKRELANLGISQTETESERESYDIDPKKLSAIFQFTRAMPLSFAAATPFDDEGKKKKRKRS